MLASEAGLEFTQVPFKGDAQTVLALDSGDINATFVVTSTVMQYARSGKARLLAVTSKTRFSQLPDVPPVAELIPGFEVDATSPEEFGAFIQAESDKFGKVIRQYNIRAD